MRERLCRWALAAVALALCALFAAGLLAYTQPMEAQVYDLSFVWEGETPPEGWAFSDKGWTVFTREGAEQRELSPDGLGGYTGLSTPGQTFYFSRVLSEDVDSPVLHLRTFNRSVAVFLDGKQLYTDCPEQSSGVGELALPMLGWDRTEPVVISLPPDYLGKTLTIAQSTGLGEKQLPEAEATVYPCPVTLSCGYAYESGLIAQSFQTAVPAALCCAAALLLLALMVWQAFHGKAELGLLWAALALFFWMLEVLGNAPFFYAYFGRTQFDFPGLARFFSLAALLFFLSSRAGKRRWVLWGLTGLYTLSVVIFFAVERRIPFLGSDLLAFLTLSPPTLLGLAALLAALVLGGVLWWKESRFYRFFLPLTCVGVLLIATGTMLTGQGFAALDQAITSISELTPGYLLWRLRAAALTAAVLSAAAEVISGEVARRAEAQALAERERMAIASYEGLLRQQQEVLMLRHDMTRHLRALQGMVTEPQAAAYLHALTGEAVETRTMANTGNQMIDLLLNSRLAAAQDAGIAVELQLAQAPERLGLSDTELCSLLMNLLDNAVAGAQAPGVAKPYLKLDLHIKNGFFVFVCENAATREWMEREHRKKPMQTHGLGKKIIQQIVARHSGLLQTETGNDFYRVTLALPISA